MNVWIGRFIFGTILAVVPFIAIKRYLKMYKSIGMNLLRKIVTLGIAITLYFANE